VSNVGSGLRPAFVHVPRVRKRQQSISQLRSDRIGSRIVREGRTSHGSLLAAVRNAQVEIEIGKSTVAQVSDNREMIIRIDIDR